MDFLKSGKYMSVIRFRLDQTRLVAINKLVAKFLLAFSLQFPGTEVLSTFSQFIF